MTIETNRDPQPYPGPLTRALHLFAMVQVAIAWPLYDLLSRFPEFFVARQSQAADIWLFVLVLSLVLPAALAGLSALAFLVNRRFGRAVHLALMAVLFLLLGLSLFSRSMDSALAVSLALAMCLLCTVAYRKTRAGPLFVSFLAPAVIAVPALFLTNGDVAALLEQPPAAHRPAGAADAGGTPIIFVVFDEFPTFVLLDGSGAIDAERFPHFAALAGGSHWFPNATTVATSTVLALPAIVTGQYPAKFVAPHLGEYPNNLFTWLADTHDMNVQEAVTALCSSAVCGKERQPPPAARLEGLLLDATAIYANILASELLAGRLPIVNQSWKNFWSETGAAGSMYEHRMDQLADFVSLIQATGKPGLDFMHVNFPHIPYEYLPSGRRYPGGWHMPGVDFTTDSWGGDRLLTVRGYQRFVLQLQALDRWLGTLVERLRDLGMYDRSIIVLTADHGVSFTPGNNRRDAPPLENLESSILPVPLIIKAPGQTAGVVSRRNAETVDIMPTLAELLGRQTDWEMDGVSLLGPPKSDAKRAVHRFREFRKFETDTGRIEQAIMRSVRESLAFDYNDLGDPSLTQAGRSLLGRDAVEFTPGADGVIRGQVAGVGNFGDVRLGSSLLPALVSGTLDDAEGATPVAIALNGKIEALTLGFRDGGQWRFSAMLPETAFVDGRNTLRLYRLELDGAGRPALFDISPPDDRRHANWEIEGGRLARDGIAMPNDAVGIQGRLDYVSHGKDSVEIMGWAIDKAESRKVESILVFDRGRLVHAGGTGMIRDETHQFGVILTIGFQVVIPEGGGLLDRRSPLRVFAVTADGRSREITAE